VLSQRALFQANPDFHRLGQSQTNIFSYQIYLFRVPIVTIDESIDWDDEELPIFHLGSPRKMDPTKCQVSFQNLRKKLFFGELGGVHFIHFEGAKQSGKLPGDRLMG
jgi:hypothetical protein